VAAGEEAMTEEAVAEEDAGETAAAEVATGEAAAGDAKLLAVQLPRAVRSVHALTGSNHGAFVYVCASLCMCACLMVRSSY